MDTATAAVLPERRASRNDVWKKRTPEEDVMSLKEQRAMLGDRLSFAASEAYKLLRTNLTFALPDEQRCRVVGITSASRGEGKSTTSINLAYTIAETGKRVLLVEADMRRPNLARRLAIDPAPGLSNLLAGLCREGTLSRMWACWKT